MIYHLRDLLQKMGAPELRDRKRLEWYYFDKTRNTIAGYAEIRLEAGGEFVVAELKRYHEADGQNEERFEESFFLYAERTARPEHYRITRMTFDGQDYGHPTKPISELGLGVFHARALDISIRMIEQTFNKGDMLEPAEKTPAPVTAAPAPATPPMTAALTGVKNARARSRVRNIAAGSANVVEQPEKTARQEAYGVVVPFRPRQPHQAVVSR